MKRNFDVADGLFHSNFASPNPLNPGDDTFITYVPVELLEDDPDNEKIYSKREVALLAESIKEEGIKEPIRAYKRPRSSKYLIQSGHTRKRGAIMAGLKEVPVIVLDWVEDERLRRRYLVDSNMYNRHKDPLTIAREINTYMSTFEDMSKMDLIHKMAEHLGMSDMTLRRYLTLLDLIPELQEKANQPDLYSMAGLVEGKAMTPEQQKLFNDKIDAYVAQYNEIDKTAILTLAREIKSSDKQPLETKSKAIKKTFESTANQFVKKCRAYVTGDNYDVQVLIKLRDELNEIIQSNN